MPELASKKCVVTPEESLNYSFWFSGWLAWHGIKGEFGQRTEVLTGRVPPKSNWTKGFPWIRPVQWGGQQVWEMCRQGREHQNLHRRCRDESGMLRKWQDKPVRYIKRSPGFYFVEKFSWNALNLDNLHAQRWDEFMHWVQLPYKTVRRELISSPCFFKRWSCISPSSSQCKWISFPHDSHLKWKHEVFSSSWWEPTYSKQAASVLSRRYWLTRPSSIILSRCRYMVDIPMDMPSCWKWWWISLAVTCFPDNDSRYENSVFRCLVWYCDDLFKRDPFFWIWKSFSYCSLVVPVYQCENENHFHIDDISFDRLPFARAKPFNANLFDDAGYHWSIFKKSILWKSYFCLISRFRRWWI